MKSLALVAAFSCLFLQIFRQHDSDFAIEVRPAARSAVLAAWKSWRASERAPSIAWRPGNLHQNPLVRVVRMLLADSQGS
jgi:hypothetical protein